jgi:hypothetical protein
MIKIVHIAAMELFTVYILWNVIRMWLKKPPIKQRIIRFSALVLGAAGIAAGVYLFAYYYHFHSPVWLQVKFFLIVISLLTGIMGSLRHNKWLLLSSLVLNVIVIVVANLKF